MATIADQILQLKKDFDAVYNAGVREGETPTKRVTLKGPSPGNTVLDLQVENNTIYDITNYYQVNITVPRAMYSAYLYITLPNIENAGITLPDNINKAGDRIETSSAGEAWELSLDSTLGALSLNSSRFKYE